MGKRVEPVGLATIISRCVLLKYGQQVI